MTHRRIIIPLLISVIIFIILFIYIKKTFSIVNTGKSSCKENIFCSPKFDLKISGIPLTKALCHDMVSCKSVQVKKSLLDSSNFDINLDNLSSMARIPNIGCFDIPKMLVKKANGMTKMCCRGDLTACVSIQSMLSENFNMHLGFSFTLGSSMCKYLPSCFIENDSSPYVLFPVPDFYIEPWKDKPNLKYPVNVEKSGLNKAIALGFGNLGGMPLSRSQAIIYVVKLPAYKDVKYFSFQPYLFQTGRYKNMFPQDLPFASLTDSFNITDLIKMTDNEKVQQWINDGVQPPVDPLDPLDPVSPVPEIPGSYQGLSIVVILTHNKLIAEQIYKTMKNPFDFDESKRPNVDMNKIFSELTHDMSNLPIICIPLPAASTYGNTTDPLDRDMYKGDFCKTNKYISADTPLYDWKTDTIGMVARFTPTIDSQNEDTNEGFKKWKNDNEDQKNTFVLGVEMKEFDDKKPPYEPFKLSDQNGFWDDDKKWKGGYDKKITLNTSSWKLQTEYTGKFDFKAVQDNMDIITQDMKDIGYGKVRDVIINSQPSPFPHYNEYVTELSSSKCPNSKCSEQNMIWSQSGVDLTQYNVATFGDCRDTVYPTTNTFCLGPYDVIVLVSYNYMENGDVLYNNLNIYDTESQTSLASFRGDHSKSIGKQVYSLAASRLDLTCAGNLPKSIDNVKFLPTGSHSNLSASTTSTFFCQARCYVHTPPPNGDEVSFQNGGYGAGYGTSPRMNKEQSLYLVRIFSPCDKNKPKIYPSVCNNYDCNKCIQNEDNKPCFNDLMVKGQRDAKRTDKITEAICAPIRLDKTTAKNTLKLFMYVLISCLIVCIIIMISFLVSRRVSGKQVDWKGIGYDSTPVIGPIILVIVTIIIISNAFNKIAATTAYNIKQSNFQR